MDFYSNLDEFWRKFRVSDGVFIPKLVKKNSKSPNLDPMQHILFIKLIYLPIRMYRTSVVQIGAFGEIIILKIACKLKKIPKIQKFRKIYNFE